MRTSEKTFTGTLTEDGRKIVSELTLIGKTRGDLAEKMGISRVTLNAKLQGKNTKKYDLLCIYEAIKEL